MARLRKFKASGINIRVHTRHSPTEYVRFWREVFALRRILSNSNHGYMIGSMVSDSVQRHGVITGYFYKFLMVDVEQPWFDIDEHKKANDRDVQQVNIPAKLKPNLVEIPYVFDVKKHRLYFISEDADSTLTPRLVLKLLGELCKADEVKEEFPSVDLTLLTDKGKVEALLRWPVINKLEITIDRPNPIDEDDEASMYEKLQKRRVGSETRIYKKAEGEATIIPDREMHNLASIAANNGLVQIRGKNERRETDFAKSEDFPLSIREKYDPALQTKTEALMEKIFSLRRELD